MLQGSKLSIMAALAAGGLLGWLAASGKLHPGSWAGPPAGAAGRQQAADGPTEGCGEGADRGKLFVKADLPARAAGAARQQAVNKPNILIIWGDDIGWFNPSCYHDGVMGYQTPNIDRIAREGARFTDW